MNKWYYNRKFIIFILVLFISALSISIFQYKGVIFKNFTDVLKYTFGIVGILTTLYNYYQKFYLLVHRIKIILLNDDSTWNVSALYEGKFDEGILKKIETKIRSMDEDAEFHYTHNCLFQSYTKGLTLYIEFNYAYNSDEDEDEGNLLVRVRDYHASYNQSITTLDEKITPLLTMINEEIRPNKSKYNFKISFGEKNPFLGLVARNIDKSSILDFSFKTKKEIGISQRYVEVNKKGIECTTTTLTDFQSASGNFLTLVGE